MSVVVAGGFGTVARVEVVVIIGVDLAGGAGIGIVGGKAVDVRRCPVRIVVPVLGVVLVGLGVGNLVSLPPLIAQAEFAPQDVQRAVGLNVAVGQAFYAFAPAVFGILRELSHGATAAPGAAPLLFGLTALLFAAAAATFLLGQRRA